MEKISVMVNNLYARVGATISRNILRTQDMCLMGVSVTPCGCRVNHGSVDGFSVELIDPEKLEKNHSLYIALFSYGKPDVIVDLSSNSFLKDEFPTFQPHISFILSEALASDELNKKAGKANLNIVFLPEDSSEEKIMQTLRFVNQKVKEDSWGNVFTERDVKL